MDKKFVLFVVGFHSLFLHSRLLRCTCVMNYISWRVKHCFMRYHLAVFIFLKVKIFKILFILIFFYDVYISYVTVIVRHAWTNWWKHGKLSSLPQGFSCQGSWTCAQLGWQSIQSSGISSISLYNKICHHILADCSLYLQS